MTTSWRVWIRCPGCQHTVHEDGMNTLRRAGMIRRAGPVEREMLVELLQAVAPRLTCVSCGHVGQQWGEVSDDDDWPQTACQACGRPIPAARLAAVPGTRLCANCQSHQEQRATDVDEVEYCPKCGAAMRLVTKHDKVTRYQWRCAACGVVDVRR